MADSDPIGVLAACNDYLQTFGLPQRVNSLGGLAQLIGALASTKRDAISRVLRGKRVLNFPP